MDQWVEVQVEEGAVKLLECPRCKAAVRSTVRYNGTINKTLQVVERVKEKLRGEVRPLFLFKIDFDHCSPRRVLTSDRS